MIEYVVDLASGLPSWPDNLQLNLSAYISPQVPSVFACKVLGTLMLHNNHSYYNPEFVQAACKKFEAEISELKNRLKTQETETWKANAKF